RIQGFLFGTAVGDAMGVPVEFTTRNFLKNKPVEGLRGYGTHHQPAGTWSDDSALTFQTVEAIIQGLNYQQLGNRFLNWYLVGEWTAHGSVFDIGISTRNALDRIEKGVDPVQAGETSELCNGNGSLMRIMPLAFYFQYQELSEQERFEVVRKVSSITHGHIRSSIACYMLVSFAQQLLAGKEKIEAYRAIQQNTFIEQVCPPDEAELFHRITKEDITQLTEKEIYSSGYVLHSLEAALWSFLTTNSYSEAVLKAVNLADDADTTGSVTGGLAGLYYDFKGIPSEWVQKIARYDDIENLAIRFADFLRS
ncbi:MAG: ADP-ribosylglycohydrolase family protein, partial [Siphonobacter sp.]